MFSGLTRAGRWRAATTLALFYALCSVAPAAAFAFGDATRAAECILGDDDHGLHAVQPHAHAFGAAHSHAVGTPHEHGMKADSAKQDESGKTPDGKTSGGKCCGLISVNALPASLASGGLPDLPRVAAVARVERLATGQPPVRLDRPPNTRLSH